MTRVELGAIFKKEVKESSCLSGDLLKKKNETCKDLGEVYCKQGSAASAKALRQE